MTRVPLAVLALAWSFSLAPAAVAGQDPPARKRVAVLDFDYATVHAYVSDIWGSDQDIGKGFASAPGSDPRRGRDRDRLDHSVRPG